MEKYQFCNTHQERVEFVSRDFNNNQLIGICLKCLPLPQGVPYQQINNVIINIENNKTYMMSLIEEQKIQNKAIIRKLIDFVKEFQKEQQEKIQNLINQGELEINKIEKKYNNSQKQISEYNASMDVGELMNLYNILQNDNDLAEIQYKLQEMLQQIQQHSFLLDSYKILQEFPSIIRLDLQNENQNYLKKIQKCSKHNEIIIGIDLSQKQNTLDCLICYACIKQNQQKVSLTALPEVEKIWKEYYNNTKSNYQHKQTMVQTLMTQSTNQISDKCNKIQKKLEAFLKVLSNYKINKQKDQKFERKFNSFDYTSIQHLQRLKKIINLPNLDWKQFQLQLNNQFQWQVQILTCNSLNRIRQYEQVSFIQFEQVDQIKTKIQYDQISASKQKEYCNVIAMNSEGSIVVTAGFKNVKIFELKNGHLNQLQQFDGDDYNVLCIEFMYNKNIFVSGGTDETVKIWSQSTTKYWSVTQTLLGHTDFVHCVIITQSGDHIFSSDDSIRLWYLENETWSSRIILEYPHRKKGLCLNESESKLICSGSEKIFIMQQIRKNEWSLISEIQGQYGSRICFITDDIFAFQSKSESMIIIYEQQASQKLFKETKRFKIKNKYTDDPDFNFPLKFIKSKQVLFSNFKYFFSIIRRDQKGEFFIDQCIEFKKIGQSGTISNDGEYLVLWDDTQNEIQVRQYKLIMLN